MTVTSENQIASCCGKAQWPLRPLLSNRRNSAISIRNRDHHVKIAFMSSSQFAWNPSRWHGTYCIIWPSPATYTPYPLCVSGQVQYTQWVLSLGMQVLGSCFFLTNQIVTLPWPFLPNLYKTIMTLGPVQDIPGWTICFWRYSSEAPWSTWLSKPQAV